MIRFRHTLPPFSVVDRYVLREFLRFYVLALVGFTAFVLLFDAMGRIDTFIDHRASVGEIGRYYLYILPYNMLLVAPVAPLLATFLCLGYMTRFREVLVLQSSGISLYRIFLPLYVAGLLLGVLSLIGSEFVMPEANRRARTVMDAEIKGRSMRNLGSRLNVTYLGRENRRFIIRRYDVPRQTMVDATIQRFDGDRLVRRIDAKKGIYRDGTWYLVDGIDRRFSTEGVESASPFDTLGMVFPEGPDAFAKEDVQSQEMSYRELKSYAERVRESGATAEAYETEAYLRLSFPLVSLVVILIASSLAVQIRRGGVALGFGLSLGIAFLYWCGIRAGQVLGHAGTIPPLLAAWLGNIVFIAIGIVLLIRTPK